MTARTGHMDITETRSAGVVTLALKGRLDGTAAKEFETRILALIDAGDCKLIIDLAELDYINSVGLRVFMAAAKLLKPLGGRIVLCALQPSIQHVFDISGLSTIFSIAEPVREQGSRIGRNLGEGCGVRTVEFV